MRAASRRAKIVSKSAADFRAFDPLSQPEAAFRENVWESGVLKASRESHEFLARRTRRVDVNEGDSGNESRVLSRSPHSGTAWSSRSLTSRRCHPDPLTCRRRVYWRAQPWRPLESVGRDHPYDLARERRRDRLLVRSWISRRSNCASNEKM